MSTLAPARPRQVLWSYRKYEPGDYARVLLQALTPKLYRWHGCTRQHRTYAALAKCTWRNAIWISGEGAYALVGFCPRAGVHASRWGRACVMLFESLDEAREGWARAYLDECTGYCCRDHALFELDLKAKYWPREKRA
jgi:hypothetical protein